MPPQNHSDRRWLHGWKRRARHRPVFWKSSTIERHIGHLFRDRWIPLADFHKVPLLGDSEYYLPTLAEARAIIRNSHLDAKTYARFRFDCEDFAYVLKANFCQAAYRHKRRQYAYCFGIVWGEELWTGKSAESHAMNWVLTSDAGLRLVEPQTAKDRPLKSAKVADRRIYLLLA